MNRPDRTSERVLRRTASRTTPRTSVFILHATNGSILYVASKGDWSFVLAMRRKRGLK
jgi:hypothetical protein